MLRNYGARIGANCCEKRMAGNPSRNDGHRAAGLTEEPRAPTRTAVKEVARHLRERIAAHTIPPGARLREWDVAADFGVPRLTAREALEALVHLGFVERQPNRGIVVRRRELGEVLRLFEMREVNEGLCARIAARNMLRDSWGDLIELFGAPMQDIVDRKDLHAYVRHYEQFRHRLVDAAGSPPLAELLQRLNDMTSIYGRRVLLVSDRTKHALDDHRAVLAALQRGDAAAAEEARRTTIANVKAAVEHYHEFVL
jgi:DNA-binding GntR family transcriptional regulator